MTAIDASASEFLKVRLSPRDAADLEAVRSNDVLKLVAEYVELCDPASVFVFAHRPEDLEFVRDAAVADGEQLRLPIDGLAIQPKQRRRG